MSIFIAIRDETPENAANDIEATLRVEAGRLGATLHRKVERKGLVIDLTIDVTLGSNYFRLNLTYLESYRLQYVSGTIGSGFISAGPDRWELELLPRDWQYDPDSPPFRWGLYPHGRKDVVARPPSHILDSALLRALLQRSLSSAPPASP